MVNLFSKFYDKNNDLISDVLSKNVVPSKEELLRILSKNEFSLEDVYLLVQCFGNKEFESLIAKEATTRRKAQWHNKLFLVPPLYVTNRCINNCKYCPWRKDNLIPRANLSLEEFKKEVHFLVEEGYKTIELVGASDPLMNGKEIADLIKLTKNMLGEKGSVGLNFESTDFEDYVLFREAGLDFMVLWQETYHRQTYKEMHPSQTKKSNMDYRLDAFDRALTAGIKKISLAFLGGLYDFRYELLFLFLHSNHLKETYGVDPFIIGTPRWKYVKGQILENIPFEYTDEQWKFVASIIKLIFPNSFPWFSTRENFELSKKVIYGGGMLFTLDCSTSVGGYVNKKSSSQFPVCSQSLSNGIKWLKSLGYSPELILPK